MRSEAGSQRCGTSKDEEGVQRIEDDWDEGVASEAVVPARRNEVEERQDGEDCDKHIVVDSRRVAREGLRDHGADEGQDNDHEEELECPEAEIDDA